MRFAELATSPLLFITPGILQVEANTPQSVVQTRLRLRVES